MEKVKVNTNILRGNHAYMGCVGSFQRIGRAKQTHVLFKDVPFPNTRVIDTYFCEDCGAKIVVDYLVD